MSHSDPGGRCASNHSRLVNARVPIRGAAVGPGPAARPVSKPRTGGGGTTAPRRLTGRGGAGDVGGEEGMLGDQATRTKPIGVS